MSHEQPLSLSQTVNTSSMSEASLQSEYLLLTRWIVQNAPQASGLTPTREMNLAVSSIQRIEQEMHQRCFRRLASGNFTGREQPRGNVSARRLAFAQTVQSDSRYKSIIDPAFGTDAVGYYYSVRYMQNGFLFQPDYYVEAIGKVYDLEGNMIWMTEMGLTRPLVDPVSVIIGAASGGTGAVSLSNFARASSTIPQRVATQALQNDLLRSMSRRTSVRIIPSSVMRALRERAQNSR